MPLKTVAVIGATGLIGSELVKQLQNHQGVDTIRVLVRRPVTFHRTKVAVKLVDFDDNESFKLAIDGADVVFCAVGTTQKKVNGDKAAYRKVDYAIPVNAARFCAETGCSSFLLVSSVGADSNSGNFYLRLKGEVEDAARKLAIPSVGFFRPSLLLGERKESRFGERLAQGIMPLLSPLLLGSLRKYKPIDASEVAAAMIRAAFQQAPGYSVYEYPMK